MHAGQAAGGNRRRKKRCRLNEGDVVPKSPEQKCSEDLSRKKETKSGRGLPTEGMKGESKLYRGSSGVEIHLIIERSPD